MSPVCRRKEKSVAFGTKNNDDFGIFQSDEDYPSTVSVRIAFASNSREAVDAFNLAAIAAGDRSKTPPGTQAEYHSSRGCVPILQSNFYAVSTIFCYLAILSMFYTFAAKVIADEKILGTFGDFARKLGTTVCAKVHDPQILDGYIDPDILVFGVRTKETERYGNGEAEGLWYYSSDKQHLQEVRKIICEFLQRMEKEVNLSAIVSDVYEFTSSVSPSQVSSVSIPRVRLRAGMRGVRSPETKIQPQPSEVRAVA